MSLYAKLHKAPREARWIREPTTSRPARLPARRALCTCAATLCASLLASPVLGAQGLTIRGFTDVSLLGNRRLGSPASTEAASSSAFRLGQFDLYLTSNISDRLSILAETVFEYDDDAGEFVVDVERVLLGYALTNRIRVVAGKHHLPIGYWNNAYHHGEALQPTIGRPLLFRFEDNGGVLPIHSTGVLLSARDLTSRHIGFDALVSNSAGGSPDSDLASSKAVTLAVHSQVTSALQVGVSAHHDHLSAGTPSRRGGTLQDDLRQQIVGGYAAFFGSRLEAVAEVQRMRERALSGAKRRSDDRWSEGVVVYAGIRQGDLIPYFRYDELRTPATDTYLPPGRIRVAGVGARYEYSALGVLKLEIRRRQAPGRRDVEFALQAAVGF